MSRSAPAASAALLPSLHTAAVAERELFDSKLRGFVPPTVFDVHAHLFNTDHGPAAADEPRVFDVATYSSYMHSWMGDLAPQAGLFFGFPSRGHDTEPDNALVLHEVKQSGSRGLLLVRPTDDPDQVAARVATEGWAGFKVYHFYANRPDTFNASMAEFLPDWIWQIADRFGLVIMYHMVRSHALTDPENQREIRAACLRYPNAKLILAHAARGFCADHTIDGIDAVADLDNVFFDTSAIAEPGALMAILQRTGSRRLIFGSDFPISQMRGRNISLGDGFFWAYDTNVDFTDWAHGQPMLNGIECLLALRQAARLCHLRDDDLEHIFSGNAQQLLTPHIPPPTHTHILSHASPRVSPCKPTGNRTQARYDFAKTIIPGGTQLLSKRPEMQAPDAWPPYYSQAKGIEVVDLDGRRYKDFSVCGIGATLLGFSDPDVDAAVARRVMMGSMSTLNPVDEVELAELLLALHPWAQHVRFTRSGGEAMAASVRIARASTDRSCVAFCGYHGWADWYIAANLPSRKSDRQNSEQNDTQNNGGNDKLSGHLLPGLEPAGVPRQLADTAFPFSYNKLEQLEAIAKAHGDDLAAIVMEPTRYDDPQPGFLEGIREIADRIGAVLIFDEITIGWRITQGGAHLKYGVNPDIAVFSKATGNGFPIAAILGTERCMSACQKSFISSTMWTEGIGPAAALAAIRKIVKFDVAAHVNQIGELYQEGLRKLAAKHGMPMHVGGRYALNHIGFDCPEPAAVLTLYTRLMLERGYLAGGGFYPTFAHQPHHVEDYLTATDDAFAVIKKAINAGDVLERIDGKVKHTGFARLT